MLVVPFPLSRCITVLVLTQQYRRTKEGPTDHQHFNLGSACWFSLFSWSLCITVLVLTQQYKGTKEGPADHQHFNFWSAGPSAGHNADPRFVAC